jgi:hypothetical protein
MDGRPGRPRTSDPRSPASKALSADFQSFTGVWNLKAGAGLVLFIRDLPFAKRRGRGCPDRPDATGFDVSALTIAQCPPRTCRRFDFRVTAAEGVTQKPTMLTNQMFPSKFFFHESAR